MIAPGETAARPPRVMISSTFYDLHHEREALRRFLGDDLGYQCLVSEHSSFPIDPDLPTIENCRERVVRDADVLVLMVGKRYGSIDSRSARSVTNLEYLAARQKGIPIYAFVQRGVLELLPVWRQNPDGNFNGIVDTPLLFDFVHQIRTVDGLWMQEFDTPDDVIAALRIHFAHQFTTGLQHVARMKEADAAPWLEGVRGETLRIALEKRTGWEYRLFASSLRDAVQQHHRLRLRHQSGISMGLGDDVSDPSGWLQARVEDAKRIAGAIERLLNEALPLALGKPGEPGEPKMILFVAESLGNVYRDALLWAMKLRTANIDSCFREPASTLGEMLDYTISQVEGFAPKILDFLDDAILRTARGEKVAGEFMLTAAVPPELSARFGAEMTAARPCWARKRALAG
jgi:hypothetical protein